MVNNNANLRILAAPACELKAKGDRQLITNGPIYCLATVQAAVSVDMIFVLNDKANSDQSAEFSPELLDEELVPYIKALTINDRESSERCATSIGRTVDCDGYAMRWSRASQKRWIHAANIYVKFGFIENNPKLLVISVHPSRYK